MRRPRSSLSVGLGIIVSAAALLSASPAYAGKEIITVSIQNVTAYDSDATTAVVQVQVQLNNGQPDYIDMTYTATDANGVCVACDPATNRLYVTKSNSATDSVTLTYTGSSSPVTFNAYGIGESADRADSDASAFIAFPLALEAPANMPGGQKNAKAKKAAMGRPTTHGSIAHVAAAHPGKGKRAAGRVAALAAAFGPVTVSGPFSAWVNANSTFTMPTVNVKPNPLTDSSSPADAIQINDPAGQTNPAVQETLTFTITSGTGTIGTTGSLPTGIRPITQANGGLQLVGPFSDLNKFLAGPTIAGGGNTGVTFTPTANFAGGVLIQIQDQSASGPPSTPILVPIAVMATATFTGVNIDNSTASAGQPATATLLSSNVVPVTVKVINANPGGAGSARMIYKAVDSNNTACRCIPASETVVITGKNGVHADAWATHNVVVDKAATKLTIEADYRDTAGNTSTIQLPVTNFAAPAHSDTAGNPPMQILTQAAVSTSQTIVVFQYQVSGGNELLKMTLSAQDSPDDDQAPKYGRNLSCRPSKKQDYATTIQSGNLGVLVDTTGMTAGTVANPVYLYLNISGTGGKYCHPFAAQLQYILPGP